MSSASAITDLSAKFKGCLVGSLIGDCLGAFFEGQKKIAKSILQNFFSDILTESKPVLPYTDDTVMTLSVAESFIENKKICSTDLAKRFVNGFFENANRRYGMNAARIFVHLMDSDFEDIFLPAKTSFNGSGSEGNGAAMRVAPIALIAHDKDEEFIKNAVEQCSFITHTHPNGYNGAILQCLAVHLALKLESSKELDPIKFLSKLEYKMREIEMKDEAPYCDSLQKIKNLYLQKEELSTEEIAEYLGNNVLALKSVPMAIYSFLRSLNPLPDYESSNPFVRAIYFAISVGGDTDTIASMAGSIAGAYYGIDAMPHNIQRRCEKIQDIERLADDLLIASQT